ncbi:hypothetical protein K1719_009181 [Acacia pycnantha]|nr:hypothetical protein K1719_009181 [Acacia pycnantha]
MDSCRSTALHLASAEGHVHIVKELLQVFDDACLVRDEEGRIPLHYAAMRGRIEVMRELVEAKPESLSYRVNGKTVFHLCVKYNHLETLQALVELELAVTRDLINFTSISYPYYFHYYLKYNTVAFVSSLGVALLLVSGVPLKHKAVIWMLSIGMFITLTFLTLTYLNGLYLVTRKWRAF